MGVTIKVSRSLSFNFLLNFSNVLNVISVWISKKASQLIYILNRQLIVICMNHPGMHWRCYRDDYGLNSHVRIWKALLLYKLFLFSKKLTWTKAWVWSDIMLKEEPLLIWIHNFKKNCLKGRKMVGVWCGAIPARPHQPPPATTSRLCADNFHSRDFSFIWNQN